MIIEYAGLHIALNPCEKYQIIYALSVHSYSCTCCETNIYPCKSKFVWSVHIQVMLEVISFSILNMHELVERWLPVPWLWRSILKNKLTVWERTLSTYFSWTNNIYIVKTKTNKHKNIDIILLICFVDRSDLNNSNNI